MLQFYKQSCRSETGTNPAHLRYLPEERQGGGGGGGAKETVPLTHYYPLVTYTRDHLTWSSQLSV